MRARFGRDDGQVLMLALVFLGFVALVLAATLTAAASSLHATQLSTQQRDERYAAEAGILAAAGRMQSDPNQVLGRDPGANPLSTPDCGFHPSSDGSGFVVNSVQVDVTCSPRTGSGAGTDGANRPPYSVLALANGPGPGGNEGVIPVNVPNLQVFGPVGSEGGACLLPSGLPACNMSPAGDPGQGGMDPRYSPDSPSAPATIDPVPSCDASSATFSPGTYTSPPSIAGCNKPWWFKPGDYYFDFTNNGSHQWIINTTVVGGLTTGWDTRRQAPTLPGSCRTEQNLAATDGVQFVFGGDSTMQVGATGAVELCAKPSNTEQEIAIYGMTPNVPGSGGVTHEPTVNPDPSTAVNTPGSYTPYDVPANGALINDGHEALASIPAGSAASMSVGGFTALPPGSVLTNVEVHVVHHEDPAMQSFSIAANDGPTPILSQSFATNAACDQLGRCDDLLRLRPQDLSDPSVISRLNVTFTATAPGIGGPYASSVDGSYLVLDVSLPGGYRSLVGCTQQTVGTQANPQQTCPVVSTVPGAQLYVQGTVYAPTGGLDVNGQPTDPVRFNRGIIARTVVFRPGNGGSTAGVTAGGAFNRWVVLNANVNGHLRVATTVTFDDVQAFTQQRAPAITYNNWDLK
jgi:hypothetical protein